MASSLVTFIQQKGNWSSHAAALGLVLEHSPGWKLKPIDENHFKIYSEGTFYAIIFFPILNNKNIKLLLDVNYFFSSWICDC